MSLSYYSTALGTRAVSRCNPKIRIEVSQSNPNDCHVRIVEVDTQYSIAILELPYEIFPRLVAELLDLLQGRRGFVSIKFL
jgi:hypothetical protein